MELCRIHSCGSAQHRSADDDWLARMGNRGHVPVWVTEVDQYVLEMDNYFVAIRQLKHVMNLNTYCHVDCDYEDTNHITIPDSEAAKAEKILELDKENDLTLLASLRVLIGSQPYGILRAWL